MPLVTVIQRNSGMLCGQRVPWNLLINETGDPDAFSKNISPPYPCPRKKERGEVTTN
jgi:hypothetical protein